MSVLDSRILDLSPMPLGGVKTVMESAKSGLKTLTLALLVASFFGLIGRKLISSKSVAAESRQPLD